MPENLDFDRAQYAQPSGTILPPQAPLSDFERANATDAGAFPRAILFGLAAAVLGSLLYAAFTIATHIQIGYAALGVGYLIGKAMMAGSRQVGGRNFQIASAILTYLAVSMTSVPEILWELHKKGMNLDHISPRLAFILFKYGVASPFLSLSEGLGGLISLFILFIALRAAWRLTSARAAVAAHPFTAS